MGGGLKTGPRCYCAGSKKVQRNGADVQAASSQMVLGKGTAVSNSVLSCEHIVTHASELHPHRSDVQLGTPLSWLIMALV